jgi:hypothetical protein
MLGFTASFVYLITVNKYNEADIYVAIETH